MSIVGKNILIIGGTGSLGNKLTQTCTQIFVVKRIPWQIELRFYTHFISKIFQLNHFGCHATDFVSKLSRFQSRASRHFENHSKLYIRS